MSTRIKHREIIFDGMHPDRQQARHAMLLLADLQGIEQIAAPEPLRLLISYDVTEITLENIHALLLEARFHIRNSLMAKLKQALYRYTEETQRANLAIEEQQSTRHIFMTRYQRRPHGCRDQRPTHLRNYL